MSDDIINILWYTPVPEVLVIAVVLVCVKYLNKREQNENKK